MPILEKRKDSFPDYRVFFKKVYNFKWNRRFFRISSLWLLNSPVTLPISLGDHEMNSLLGCPVNTQVISVFVWGAFLDCWLCWPRDKFFRQRVSFSFSTVNVAGVWLKPFQLYCPTMCYNIGRTNNLIFSLAGIVCSLIKGHQEREKPCGSDTYKLF